MDRLISDLTWAYFIVFGAGLVAYVAGFRRLSDALELAMDALFAVWVLCLFLNRQWGLAWLGVAVMVFMAWLDWRKRKKRKAGEALGAKSKALRDSLVRKARELRQPRPQRVPVPARES